MVVRTSAFRPIAGISTIAKTTLTSLALVGGIAAATSPAFAAPTGWSSSTQKSVLIQSNGRRIPTPYASQSTSPEFPQGGPIEEIAPGQIATDSFDGAVQGEAAIVGSPSESYADGGYDNGGASPGLSSAVAEDGTYGTAVEGVYDSPFNGSYEGGFEGQEPGPLPCNGQCGNGDCNACQQGSCGLPAWKYNAECEPMGLLQNMYLLHRGMKSDGCWTGRVDALILSRNAPGNRPLYIYSPAGGTALNANQLESIAAVGPRLSLFHTDSCGQASWEGTYIYSGGFVANRSLTPVLGGYQLADPGIYQNIKGDFDGATARLTSSLQSAELNRRWGLGSCTQFLAGFRWLQWQETLAINDAYGVATGDIGQDVYTTGCYNNLFGGQIGLDTALWRPSKHFRLEGLVKAGAYYNSAYQSSNYQNYEAGFPPAGNSVSVGQSPAVCSFAGELGLTGVIPVCCNVDFRFGYFGLWLASLAQPVNQLSNQILIPDQPAYGSLATNGNVALQGLSLGLEGRW